MLAESGFKPIFSVLVVCSCDCKNTLLYHMIKKGLDFQFHFKLSPMQVPGSSYKRPPKLVIGGKEKLADEFELNLN